VRPLLLALATLAVAAGCVSPGAPQASPAAADAAALEAALGAPIEQVHDHTDAALHTGHKGLELVNWSPLISQEIGTEGFAALRIQGDLAYLGTDGAHAGFLIVNVSDPRAPRLVSQYASPGGASQEAVPTWEGDYVFMNLQRQPAAPQLLTNATQGDGYGIQIVDVRDKAHPTFAGFVPVEALGSHVMFYTEHGGKRYLIYNGQPEGAPLPGSGAVYTAPPGNGVHIDEFVTSPAPALVPVGYFTLPDALTAQTRSGCFPHDQWAEDHPLTHQWLLYVAYWDCGAVIADITDPSMPKLLHVDATMAPSTRESIHFFRPDPTPRGGRIIAWSGPEIDLSPGEPGSYRAYDVTDPSSFHQIGTWRLPGDVSNDEPFLFSPHNFDFHGDLMSLAHYHAGVWVLNVSDPEHPHAIAYYLPHGASDARPFVGTVWRKTPNFPEAYFPNVYDAKWFTSPTDGKLYLLVSERGSGLYVLQLDPGLG
jgi:hypothetical protein